MPGRGTVPTIAERRLLYMRGALTSMQLEDGVESHQRHGSRCLLFFILLEDTEYTDNGRKHKGISLCSGWSVLPHA